MEIKSRKTEIKLVGIFIKDDQEGGFTGFFSSYPAAVSQGETLDEARDNLFNVLQDVIEIQDKIEEEQRIISGESSNIIKESYTFQSA